MTTFLDDVTVADLNADPYPVYERMRRTQPAVRASANRDEDVYAGPDRFDLHRPVPQQAAFGFGKHFCSGHAFSRHQIRIALEVLLRRFPGIRPDGAVPFFGWEFRAPASLPVHLG
jgi:cytochrome P450